MLDFGASRRTTFFRITLPLTFPGIFEGATIELVTAYINEPSLYARQAIDGLKKITQC